MSLVVRRATIEEIFPLRHAVLRPGRPERDSDYAQDQQAAHLSAWDGEMLVGCATVFPDPWVGGDGAEAEPRAWRLRGMAVDPSRQRGGIGRLVLQAAVDVARAAGAPLLWANGRTASLPFYESQGWRVAGPEFDAADTLLAHKPIVLDL